MEPRPLITESFHSIQGEGPNVGRPAHFIRFAKCNLACRICDAMPASRSAAWKNCAKPISVPDLQIAPQVRRIVLTGGEPTLQPLDEIIDEINRVYGRRFIFEVETNGVLVPTDEILARVQNWNVSPKLADSQESYIPNAVPLKNLPWWVKWQRSIDKTEKSICFKFVVGSMAQWIEVQNLVGSLKMAPESIWIMREGTDRTAFIVDEFNLQLVELCKSAGFNYSPRLHIILWNKTIGV